jgi:hypothetical protein
MHSIHRHLHLKGIGLTEMRTQAYNQMTNGRDQSYHDDDLEEAVSTVEIEIAESSEEAVAYDDDDDSGSLTSVD